MGIQTKRFISKKKSCSCSMPGVWRAAAFCEGMAVIFHSPRACAHVTRSMDINSYYRGAAERKGMYGRSVPIVSSQLEEKHAIFGGAERLMQCIAAVVKDEEPKCIVIANSCLAGVIGDDVESIAREAEERFGIPIVTVSTYGFLDGEYYQGYLEAADNIAKRFFKKQKQEANTALLFGDSGGPGGQYALETKRLLAELGVTVIGQYPGYIPFDALGDAAKAAALIVLGGRGQSHEKMMRLAERFKERYGFSYIKDCYPVGWDQTKKWIREAGVLFDCQEKASQLIEKEEERIRRACERFLPVTRKKKAVIVIGRWLVYFQPESILEIAGLLELDVRGIILLSSYPEKEREKMEAAIHACTDIPVISEKDGDSLAAEAEVILTTHELHGIEKKQLFLPMIPKAGAEGAIEYMQAVYRCLCSRQVKGGISYI